MALGRLLGEDQAGRLQQGLVGAPAQIPGRRAADAAHRGGFRPGRQVSHPGEHAVHALFPRAGLAIPVLSLDVQGGRPQGAAQRVQFLWLQGGRQAPVDDALPRREQAVARRARGADRHAADGRERDPRVLRAAPELAQGAEQGPALRLVTGLTMATNTEENPETDSESHQDDSRGALVPLRRLVELALEHPDIGPPLADLAYAIGQKEVGDQLVRLGTERENPRVEYFVIAGYAARRSRRHADVFRATLDALRALAEQGPTPGDPDEGTRVMQLVRNALSVLMFDLKDLTREPEFTGALAERLRRLEDRLGGEVLYRTLYAQALWFTDKDASERQWERAKEIAATIGNMQGIEAVWNARGTWAKEADRDLDKAERAYRRGLEASPESALLLHNLAQVLVERAEHASPSPAAARHLLNQAQDLLRRTLRADVPRLRRHIHATRDRLEAVRRSLPKPDYPSEPAQQTAHHPPAAAAAPPRPQRPSFRNDDRR